MKSRYVYVLYLTHQDYPDNDLEKEVLSSKNWDYDSDEEFYWLTVQEYYSSLKKAKAKITELTFRNTWKLIKTVNKYKPIKYIYTYKYEDKVILKVHLRRFKLR